MATTKRRPKDVAKRRRNPARSTGKPKPRKGGAKRELEAARRLSRLFHGTPTEVVELSPAERRPLPRYAMLLGRLHELTYMPDATSKRGGYRWQHKSGDRGPGKPRSRRSPLVVIDPATKRPALVMDRSPMKLTRRGLVG